MTELKRTRDINRAIEKVAESLPEIEPLPDNPDHQTMVKKLAEIEDRAKLLLPHGKKLTNKKDRAFFLAEIKKLFASCKELRINLKNSRGDSLLYPYLAKIFEPEIVIINKLRSFLDHAAGEAEAGAGESIAAAEEAEATVEAKKSREAAKGRIRAALKDKSPEELVREYEQNGNSPKIVNFLRELLAEIKKEDKQKNN